MNVGKGKLKKMKTKLPMKQEHISDDEEDDSTKDKKPVDNVKVIFFYLE